MVSAGPHLYSIGAGGAGGEGAGRGGGGANRRSATAAAAPHDRRIFFKIFLIKQIIININNKIWGHSQDRYRVRIQRYFDVRMLIDGDSNK